MESRRVWCVVRVVVHNQSTLLAICEDVAGKSGEDIAREFCTDETCFIGPWPSNTLIADNLVIGWPGCYCPYYPHKQQTRES
jgi:hypothetical protein